MFLGAFIPGRLEVIGGLRPRVRAQVFVRHDEDSSLVYVPNGVNSVEVFAKTFPSGSRHYVGQATAFRYQLGPILNANDTSQNFFVEIPLDRDLVWRLNDEHRTHPAETIAIELEWYMVASRPQRSPLVEFYLYRVEWQSGPTEQRMNPTVSVSPSDWAKIMTVFGWPDQRLIEIRFPTNYIAQFSAAFDKVREAEVAYEGRQDANTLLACEQALESLLGGQTIKRGQDEILSAFERRLNKIADPEKRRFIANTLTSAVLYVRRRKHDQAVSPTDSQFEVDSADAEFGLILTKGALAYLSKV